MSDTTGTARNANALVHGRDRVLGFDVPRRMTVIVDEAPERLPVELLAVINATDEHTPTLVATVHGYEGHQPQFTRAALEGLERDLVDPHIVGVADWAVPGHWGAVETGCVIDYFHRSGDDERLVAGRDYLAVARGWAIQVTTTASPQDRLVMDTVFEAALPRLSILRTPTSRDTVTTVAGPLPLECSATGQRNRVSLSRWREQAAWTHTDAVSVRPETLEYLASVEVDAPVVPDDAALLQDLADSRLLLSGSLAGKGLVLAEVLQSAEAGLNVSMYREGRQTAMSCAIVGETAAVLWGPGYGQLEYGHRGVASEWRPGAAVLPTAELSATVCGWLGIGPAWTDDEDPIMAPARLVDRFVTGKTVDIAAFTPETRPLIWHLSTWSGDRTLDDTFGINGGDHGHFQARADTLTRNTVVFWPTDSSWWARMIEDRVQAAYFDRPVTLDA